MCDHTVMRTRGGALTSAVIGFASLTAAASACTSSTAAHSRSGLHAPLKSPALSAGSESLRVVGVHTERLGRSSPLNWGAYAIVLSASQVGVPLTGGGCPPEVTAVDREDSTLDIVVKPERPTPRHVCTDQSLRYEMTIDLDQPAFATTSSSALTKVRLREGGARTTLALARG